MTNASTCSQYPTGAYRERLLKETARYARVGRLAQQYVEDRLPKDSPPALEAILDLVWDFLDDGAADPLGIADERLDGDHVAAMVYMALVK